MPTFITLIGYIIGLGAVTVIDFHGLLATRSEYWTLATIRTHKITKPLIWLGIILVTVGRIMKVFTEGSFAHQDLYFILILLLVLNGLFLSFVVSPMLLAKEKSPEAAKILPSQWQVRIFISFIFSVVGWWGSFILLGITDNIF